MKRMIFFVVAFAITTSKLLAQQGVTQCGTPTGQPKFPIEKYQELPDPQMPVETTWAQVNDAKAAWGSTDNRYPKHVLPQLKQPTEITLQGWRGERVHAQAIIWTGIDLKDLNLNFTDFKNKSGDLLPADALKASFVRYVMTDSPRGGCGERDHTKFDSLLVADPIDHLLKSMELPARSVQPIWVQCQIPQSIVSGIYKGELLIKEGARTLQKLQLSIQVSSRQLPQPAEWSYHLDLWQNPFAVARYYQVPLWSKEHFDAMRPLMKMLADAGQKVITASIIHKPWNGQTEDYFETMVTWMKRADGTWSFDYTIFDRWVEFMMSVGINKQINCYSMVPWKLSFQYYDQATNSLKIVQTAPGEKEYKEIWGQMLTSFSKHLREKGWFDICMIAMDERPEAVMQEAIKVIRDADPAYKISLAGSFHENIEKDIDDYCISIGMDYPEDIRIRRMKENKPTTYYTSCTEEFPNVFALSNPAEASWMSFYAAKKKLNGYLRWAYNSWPIEPLLDSRFHTWSGGDTYLVYPGARSSIRFERLIEGIQAHEKISILRREFEEKKNKAGLKKIEQLLLPFNIKGLSESSIPSSVRKANQILNTL